MGSFNTSCAVSQLAIKGGDEVKLFIVVGHKPTDRNPLYPDHFFDLVGLPFDATYYDYGQYRLIDSEYNRKVWEVHSRYLREKLIALPAGERSRDEEVNPETITFDELQSAIWEDRAKINYQFYDWEPEVLRLAIYPVHKDLYNSLSVSYQNWNGEFITADKAAAIKNNPMVPYFMDSENFMANYNEDELEMIGEGDDAVYTEESEFLMDVHAELRMAEIMSEFNREPRIFKDNGVHLNEHNTKRVMKLTQKEYFEFAQELIEAFVFQVNLMYLNIHIIPSMTSGQSYLYAKHIAFHEKVLEIANAKLNECEDWES